MRVVWPISLVAVILALLLAIESYRLSPPVGGGNEFIANLLLNVVAEFLSVAAGLLFAVWLGSRVASAKLSIFAQPLLGLIQQLREDKKISQLAARKGVIVTVSLLSEGIPPGSRLPDSSERKCRICGLKSNAETYRGRLRCKDCKLPGEVWASGYQTIEKA